MWGKLGVRPSGLVFAPCPLSLVVFWVSGNINSDVRRAEFSSGRLGVLRAEQRQWLVFAASPVQHTQQQMV